MRLAVLIASVAVVGGASVVELSTLWAYRHPDNNTVNPGAGGRWGASIGVTRHGTVLVGSEVGVQCREHRCPTQLEIRRSTDGGLTWGNSTVLMTPEQAQRHGGGFIVQHSTGTIFFMHLRSPWKGQRNPLTEYPLYVYQSKDDGLTWSAGMQAKSKGGVNVTGGEIIGHGMELVRGPRPGRLIIATNQYIGPGPKSGPGFDLDAYTVFSDDNGQTWEMGANLPVPFTPLEATLAELSNGSLIMSARDAQPRSAGDLCEDGEVCHSFGRSDDAGSSWVEAWTVPVRELPVHTCQPTLISTADGETLYFGAPMNMTTGDRYNYTVYTSSDGGRRWQWLTGVFGGPSGYGDMAFLPNGQLGIAFQRGLGLPGVTAGGYEMAYARVNVTGGP